MKNQILFFIPGDTPTAEEIKAADKLRGKGPFVEYVSLKQIDLNGPIIENVGVAGSVPETYRDFAIERDEPKVVEEKSKK